MHFPSRPILALVAVSALLLPSSVLAGTIGGWYLGSEVWTNLTSGVDGEVYAAVHDGDNLYVGGSFSEAGGVAAANIAQWDGTAWTNLGVGIDGTVSALAHDGTNLYVGGSFFLAGGESASNIALWNGSLDKSRGGNRGSRLGAGPRRNESLCRRRFLLSRRNRSHQHRTLGWRELVAAGSRDRQRRFHLENRFRRPSLRWRLVHLRRRR